MGLQVNEDNHPIDKDLRVLISKRYKRITRAVNYEFWNSDSETLHSRYVGSYGRGTAINTSDLDVLFQIPSDEYEHFTALSGNGPSRLLQAIKSAVLQTYPNTSIKGDGQVVVIRFSDGMKFEVLPAFPNLDWLGFWDGTYRYPDTHMGGNWMTTNPLAEQKAIDEKNDYEHSNGLLRDTCKHIRFVKEEYYKSYKLSGILIDAFAYRAIGKWHWKRDYEYSSVNNLNENYEQALLNYYDCYPYSNIYKPTIYAPGSEMKIDCEDWEILGKVLRKMV